MVYNTIHIIDLPTNFPKVIIIITIIFAQYSPLFLSISP